MSKIEEIARNFWWCWNPRATALFQSFGDTLWQEVEHNPLRLLARLDPAAIDAKADEIEAVHADLQAYLAARENKQSIVYLCCEYGLHESFPNYSGGLGVLAGDHLKSASDQDIDLMAVGLLYKRGYFTQSIGDDNLQREDYPEMDFNTQPLTLLEENGQPLTITVQLPGRPVVAQIWRADVGSIPLFLLDTDVEANSPDDRKITDALYGGDKTHRIEQELVLGIGGIRALKALKLSPTVYHMNEGHAAFSAVERLAIAVEEGASFNDALGVLKKATLFTTHTPVPAGNEEFPEDLILTYLGDEIKRLGLSNDEFIKLGKIDGLESDFGMTVFALRVSQFANGVSKLHGEVSRRMWQRVFPESALDKVPIGHVTNGIHLPTWVAPEFAKLYEKSFGSQWVKQAHQSSGWQGVSKISDMELIVTKRGLKKKLIEFVRTEEERKIASGRSHFEQNEIDNLLNENALTIGFARRFATYKRANLLISDLERIAKMLSNDERVVQFIFAGKAHPKDIPGKQLIKEIVEFSQRSDMKNRIVFLENYNMHIGRLLTQGVDVWLNNPRRPHEASGTSGMKVPVNGGLNCSVLDGWWPEAFNDDVGWAIGDTTVLDDTAKQDERDRQSLYQTIEEKVIPTYYDRDESGVPGRWMAMVRASMRQCSPVFHTDRMVLEYQEKYYSKAR